MPQDLSGTPVVHWGWPDTQDGVFWVEGSVVEEGLMLLNSGGEWDVVFLLPSAEGVEQEDGVLVAPLEELFPGVLQKKHVAIVEWVPDLEGINSISIPSLDLLSNLSRGVSVVVKSIVELDVDVELHAGSTD